MVKVRANIPKDKSRVLEEGPKTVAKIVPGKRKTMKQSTTRAAVHAPSKGVFMGDLSLLNKINKEK